MPRTKIDTQPGWNSQGDATLEISERVYESEQNLNFDITVLAEYMLRYLPDTNEVVLIKGDEILYSEEVI